MPSTEIKPVPSPPLNVPASNSTVEVHIIDTTTVVCCPTHYFVEPPIKGQDILNLPTYCFLVKNKALNRTVLFDHGGRKDWWNLAPVVKNSFSNGVHALQVSKSVNETLAEGGVQGNEVDAVIWSHWHWDHSGNAALFPETTAIVVGPGFKQTFLPGYPTDPKSPILESDLKGRHIHEAEFNDKEKIGKYRSIDYFGDGSFYLLDIPGHAIGHIGALARTTPDTFVFMGGDICHYGGAFRPTPYTPLPNTIPNDVPLEPRFPSPCPCSIFTACHPNQDAPQTTPYYKITTGKESWYSEPVAAQDSVDKMEEFDADENVFVAIAHDVGLADVVTFFPKGNMNDWKEKGWKRKGLWGFLNDLPIDGVGKKALLPGRMKHGKIVETTVWET